MAECEHESCTGYKTSMHRPLLISSLRPPTRLHVPIIIINYRAKSCSSKNTTSNWESLCTQVQVKQTLYLFIAIYKYNLIWTEKRNILSISFRLALWNQKTSWHSLWLKSRQMSRPLCNIFLTCPCVLCPSSNKAAKWITNSHMVQGLCFDNWWLRNKVTLKISNFLGHPGVV